MKLIIEDFCTIRRAEIEVGAGRIALITGPNRSGKTVVRNAMSAALMGRYDIYGVTKETAISLVRPGAERAWARVEHDDGSSLAVQWPPGKVIPRNVPDTIDEFCCGLQTPLALDTRKWRQFLSDAVGLRESEIAVDDWREDLGKVLRAIPIGAVQKDIEGLGWDGAAEQWAGKARGTRAAWAKLAGRPWGANPDGGDKVVHWRHVDDEGEMPENAAGRLAEMEEQLALHRAAAKSGALSPKERATMQADADQLPELEEKHAAAVGRVQRIELQMSQAGKTFPCPHCGGMLRFDKGSVVMDEGEPSHTVEDLRRMRADAIDKANEIMVHLTAGRDARARLKAIDEAPGKPTGNLGALQAEHERLKQRTTARKITERARQLCEQARLEHAVATFLGPDGWRRQHIVQALAPIQERLADMSQTIFGDQAWIDTDDQDMPVRFRDLPWETLTWGGDTSSTMIVLMACIQVIHAEIAAAPVVLIDMWDTLDPATRRGFLKAMRSTEVALVLFATSREKPAVDALASAKLGRTWHIEDGLVRPVGESQ